jgi:hypothetical protein
VPIILLGHAVGGIRRSVTQARTETGLNRALALAQLAVTLALVVPLTLLLAPVVVALLLLLLTLGLLPVARFGTRSPRSSGL